MSDAYTVPAIRCSVTVGVPAAEAFRVFTELFGSWWPEEYHIGRAEFAGAELEPRVGGRWYERGVDGSESDWGKVLVWEPPNRLVVTWQMDGGWRFDPDPEHASELQITFSPAGPEKTEVSLEHRLLERIIGGEATYGMISGDEGWAWVLDEFAEATKR